MAPFIFGNKIRLNLIWFIQSNFWCEEGQGAKERRLFKTLSSMPVFSQWTSAASMNASRCTRQQRTDFKNSWNNEQFECGLPKEERCSALACVNCSHRQAGWRIRQQALDAAFRGSLFAVWPVLCVTVWTPWFWNYCRWQVPRIFMIATVEEDASFLRVLAPSCMFSTGQLRSAHYWELSWRSVSQFLHSPYCLGIAIRCMPGRMERKLLVALSFILFPFYVVLIDPISYAYGASFYIQSSATYSIEDNDDGDDANALSDISL